MYAPAEDDEATTIVRYAEQQLAALHASLLGLTEAQAGHARAGARCRRPASSSTWPG